VEPYGASLGRLEVCFVLFVNKHENKNTMELKLLSLLIIIIVLAVQKSPTSPNVDEQEIALACEDGTVRILTDSLTDSYLHQVAVLNASKHRVLCVEWERNWLWAGCKDGVVVGWDDVKDRAIPKVYMSLPLGSGMKNTVFPWAIAMLGLLLLLTLPSSLSFTLNYKKNKIGIARLDFVLTRKKIGKTF